jgi:putative membrane protein
VREHPETSEPAGSQRHYRLLGAASKLCAGGKSPEFQQRARSDLYEKQSSQLVLKTTKDAKIRDFAQMMVTDHNKSTADVKVAAQASGLTPKPAALDAKKAAMIADLTKASGKTRDQVYLTQQKAAHQEALSLHQGYASAGEKPALKAAAAKIAPVVQHHIEMLSTMK